MKKFPTIYFSLHGFATPFLSKAQSTPPASTDTYHAFKFDIGLGYAIQKSGASSGNGTKARRHLYITTPLSFIR